MIACLLIPGFELRAALRKQPGLALRPAALSPVPGFAAWLKRERASDNPILLPEDLSPLGELDKPGWWRNEAAERLIEARNLSRL